MANNKKWTKEEEEILVQAIQANPHNISEALRTANATINRSFKACQFHWYGVLSPKNKPNKILPVNVFFFFIIIPPYTNFFSFVNYIIYY